MFVTVLRTEFLKLRREPITWISALAASLEALAAALFMWIVREPDRAKQLGLVGTKASLSGLSADWPSLFSMLTQACAIAGIILLAIIATYAFGREYADTTAKNMLALPVRRELFVLAKFAVVFVWYATIMALLVAENFVVGFALGLPGFSAGLAWHSVAMIAAVVGMCYLLVSPTAWVATLGKGYMLPFGFAIITLALGNIFALTGWSVWFPWSIVPLFAGAAGAGGGELPLVSAASLITTFVLGLAGTIAQTRWADNTQ